MIEELRAVFEILGNTTLQLGEYALFAGAGYIVYKMMTLASFLLLAKYFITRMFDWLRLRTIRNSEKFQEIKTGDTVMYKGEKRIVSKTLSKGREKYLLVGHFLWDTETNITKFTTLVKASEVELIG